MAERDVTVKDELVQYIEAYAASKTVANTLVQSLVAGALRSFLEPLIVERSNPGEVVVDSGS